VFEHNLSVITVVRSFDIVPRAQYYVAICVLKRTAMCKYYRRGGRHMLVHEYDSAYNQVHYIDANVDKPLFPSLIIDQ
jgi:hypothetical protein